MSAPNPTALPAQGLSELLEELVRTPDVPSGSLWARPLRPGERVGRYEILRELGRGGFGAVYEALDTELERRIALKTLRPGRSRDELATEELRREAQAAARLSHPGIVTLFEACTCAEGPYLVMELLRGETLDERLRRGAVPVREAIEITLQAARALAYAHAQGLVHRDVKPANLFLGEDGRVRLLDLGLAHLLGRRHAASAGTPAYVAPEQWRGEAVDGRADVFALGVVLYELLSGRRPFDVTDGRSGALDGAPLRPLTVRAPRRLSELVSRCLRAEARERPTAAQVAEELLDVQRGLGRGGALRRPVAVGLALGVLIALAALGFSAWRGRTGGATVALGADGRVFVAVADFVNETRDPDLDGLSGLLITSLEQSRRLRVMTRGRMIDLLRQAGKGGADRIDEALARDIGRGAGVRALLLASIRKLGSSYVAELRALDPERDEYLFTLQESAPSKDVVLALVDKLSDRARAALREPEAEVKASELDLAKAVTPSLEAYQHYFRGKERSARMDTDGAMEEFRRAIAIEPRFALAQYELALHATLMSSRGKEIIDDALRNGAQGPDKEVRLIRALHALIARRFDAVIADAREIAKLYPDDPDAIFLTELLFGFMGDFATTHEQVERLLRMRPDHHFARTDQIWILQVLGRAGEGRAIAASLVARERSPTTLVVSALARGLTGDVDGAIGELEGASAVGPLGSWARSQALAASGRTTDALESLGDGKDYFTSFAHALALGYSGRFSDGVASLESAANNPGADEQQTRRLLGWYLAAAGARDRALRVTAAGDVFPANDVLLHFETRNDARLQSLVTVLDPATFLGRLGRALVSWREGRLDDALSELRALDAPVGWFVPYYRGIAAAEAGLHEEAVEALRRFVPPLMIGSDAVFHPWLQARARIALARSLAALGRREEAREVAETQQRMWQRADADLPLRRGLEAVCREVGCRAAR